MLHTLEGYLPDLVRDVFRLCIWLTLLAAVFVPLERLAGARPRAAGRRDVIANLGYYFINSLLPALLLAMPLSLVAVAAQRIIPPALPALVAQLPVAGRLLLAFIIGETGFYWGHRLSHQIAWLWRFHAVHHSAGHMYFLVNTRAHPVDLVFTRLVGLTPLYALGLAGASPAGMATPVVVILAGTFWGFLVHADIRWRFGPLEWLVATPAFHHWHHSRVDHINRNYAAMLPVLDRVFGTHYLPRQWPAQYGIQAAHPPTLGAQLIAPMLPARQDTSR